MFSAVAAKVVSSLSFRLTACFVLVFASGLIAIIVLFDRLMADFVVTGPETALRYELDEAADVFRQQDSKAFSKHLITEAQYYGSGNVFYRFFSDGAAPSYTSDLSLWHGLPQHRITDITSGATIFLGEKNRPVRIVSKKIDDRHTIEAGIDITHELDVLRHHRYLLVIGGLTVIVFAGLIGYLAVFRTVHRIDRMTELTREISDTNLRSRVPVENEKDELGRLATTLNEMLARIEALLNAKKQLTEDLAHELRTPVTRMRTRAELALADENSEIGLPGLAENTIEECDGLLGLINSILEIAEADARVLRLTFNAVDLRLLLKNAVEFFRPLADEKKIKIWCTFPNSVFSQGDLPRLERAISNVLDNAIKYTAPHGNIEITLGIDQDNRAEIEIVDDGEGIPDEEVPRIFERFYRRDRSRSSPGNGLGLTMSQALIKAHNGEIFVSSKQGVGTRVKILLACVASANTVEEEVA